MFAVIKTPLSLAAAVVLTAACSSSGMSVPLVTNTAPQAAAPAVTIPVLASSPIVETSAPAYQTYQAAPAYTQQPALAATQAPLMIDAPSVVQTAPLANSSLIQPASVQTFNTSAPAISAPSLSAPSLSAPTLPSVPSYTIPAVPSAPMVSPTMIQPSLSPITDGFSQGPSLTDTSIVAANARTPGLPIIASNSPLLQGTVYATSFGGVAPTAE